MKTPFVRITFTLFVTVLAATGVSVTAAADSGLPWGANVRATNEVPREIEDVGIDEHLGAQLDTTLAFKDDSGKAVNLKTYLDEGKPIILSPVYYECPNLCNLHLNGMFDALKQLQWNPGKEFNLVAISIDPNETFKDAAAKKAVYMKFFGRPSTAEGIHFLTGTDESVKKIMKQVGFRYHWDPVTKQWAHTSGAMVVTPTGLISRYLYGISFEPKMLRLSLVEASNGRIGELMDKVLLFCYHYDPNRKGYAFYAYNLMRVGAGATVLLLGVFVVPYWMRQKKLRRNV
jgi:protein SCO1/2